MIRLRIPRIPWLLLGGAGVMAGLVALVWSATSGYGKPTYLPDPGVYELPRVTAVQEPRSRHSLDLELSGARIGNLTLQDFSVGADGITAALSIATGAGTSIFIDTLLIDGLQCPSFTMASSEIATLAASGNQADGNSFGYTLATVPDVVLGSTRGEIDAVISRDTPYDEVTITASGADAEIRNLTIDTVLAKDAGCTLSGLKIGEMTIQNSVFGSGDGLAIPDFTFESTVVVGSATLSGNAEVETEVR